MPPIYAAIALMCALGADCDGRFSGGLELWPDERTELSLQNRIFIDASAETQWKPIRLRGGASFLLWQRQAIRPCGRMKPSNPRCIGGIFHVEVDAAVERHQFTQVLLFPWWTETPYREVSFGLTLNRRSVHWPVYRGQIGLWPTCYEEGCWNEATWRGLGHSDTWGLAMRIDRPNWSLQFRRSLGLIDRFPALPFQRSHLRARYELENWEARMVMRWDGPQPEKLLYLNRSFGHLRLGLLGGQLRRPSVGASIWMAALRVGAAL